MQDAEKGRAEMCRCPYCDAEIDETAVLCVACKTVIVDCVHCGEPVREGVETCPHCGEPPR
jgi:predicted amidophosphoribosyltransferase